MADLEAIEKRLPKLESEAKKDPKLHASLQALASAKAVLDSGNTLFGTGCDLELLTEFNFLTAKPFVYAFNLDESDLSNASLQQDLTALVAPAEAIFVCAQVEAELSELSEAESAELLSELGQDQSGLQNLIQAGYKLLGLQTFLTAGPKEVRAWTIKRGSTAPEAAGVIHTDFQKGFIKAEVVNFDDLATAGTVNAARSAGKVRLEGKDYLMREGDVVEFRFNV